MAFSFYLKLYLATLAAFLAIDMLWLGLIARKLYNQYLGFLLSPKPNWAAAVLFYLLFIFGVLFFVVLPGLETGSLKVTLLRAALFGLLTYATYDLTNLATIKDWPITITIIDIAWGMLLTSLVAWISFLVGSWWR